MPELPPLRTLTGLTGAKAAADRTTVIATVDVTLPVLYALGWAAAPTLAAFGVLAALIGPVGALAASLVVGAAVMWLILGRSNNGLKRRHYQTLRDRATHKDGVFSLCGHQIDPHGQAFMRLVASSVPLLRVADTDVDVTSRPRQTPARIVDADAFTALPHLGRRATHTPRVRDTAAEPDLDLASGKEPQ